MTGNIITNARAISVRRALDEWRDAGESWKEKTLALAAELYAARKECGENDTQFGRWLVENGCDDLGRDARAALVNIGKHLQLSRRVMEDSRSTSAELLWDKIRPLTLSSDRSVASSPPPETPQIAQNSPAESQSTIPEKTESESEIPRLDPAALRRSGKSRLSKLPDADLVLAHVLSHSTRAALGNIVTTKRGRPIWTLLVECIKNGAFGPPSKAVVEGTPNLRIAFPWMQANDRWVSSFDLRKPNDIQKVREFILPVVLVTEDRSALAINKIRREVDRRQLQKDEQVRQELAHQRHQRKVAAGLPDGQEEVIAYGTPLAKRARLQL